MWVAIQNRSAEVAVLCFRAGFSAPCVLDILLLEYTLELVVVVVVLQHSCCILHADDGELAQGVQ